MIHKNSKLFIVAIMTKPAINIVEQVPLLENEACFGYMPRNSIVEPQNLVSSAMLVFIRIFKKISSPPLGMVSLNKHKMVNWPIALA